MSSDIENNDTALILAEVRGLTTKVNGIEGAVAGLTTEVRGVSANLTSLTRTVDRIDQRLGDVEHQVVAMRKNTDLIPAMMDAISETSSDVDDHEKRLKDHNKRIAGLEQAAA